MQPKNNLAMHPALPITIIIADDHDIYRQGFKTMIENQKTANIVFVEEACNGLELVEKTKKLQTHIVITDIKMPVMDGLEACRIIRKECRDTKVIALSMYDEPSFIFEMVDAGASGYLTKNSGQQEILNAIKTVSKGLTHFPATTEDINALIPVTNKLNVKKYRQYNFPNRK
jgi:DNA-binding NarL/FixJ family response regulator